MITIFIKGIIIGLLVSVPMGPIGVLCVQRTLIGGRFSGLISGMGAAAADAVFAMIAGFGVNYVIGLIEHKELLFEIIGSIIIILIGLKIYFTNTVKQFRGTTTKKEGRLVKHFFTVFFLTLTNPAMVFLFIWLFPILNIVLNTSNYVFSSFFVLGVFAGGTIWWFTLATMVNRLRNKLKIRSFYWFNKISGGIIVIFGIISISKVLITNLL